MTSGTIFGRSAVHGPDGRLLAEASTDRPGMAVAELDAERLRLIRESLPMLADRRADAAPIQTSTVQ